MRISDLFVVIVEPSNVQSRIIRDRLQALGVTSVVACSNGTDALDTIRNDMPDLVISSLHLPDISGAELLTYLRADGLLKDLAFVLVSSETQFRYLDPVKQAGATAVLPKPFSDEQLHTALKTTLYNVEPEGGDHIRELDLDMLNVLLVDDSPMSRKFIRKVLSGLGIRNFVEASDGAEALKQFADNYFDLVVTDYNMPNMDGRELTEKIRQQSSQRSVPVLMVTSEASEGRLAGVQQAGVSALCDKPFASEDVKQLLINLLADGK